MFLCYVSPVSLHRFISGSFAVRLSVFVSLALGLTKARCLFLCFLWISAAFVAVGLSFARFVRSLSLCLSVLWSCWLSVSAGLAVSVACCLSWWFPVSLRLAVGLSVSPLRYLSLSVFRRVRVCVCACARVRVCGAGVGRWDEDRL